MSERGMSQRSVKAIINLIYAMEDLPGDTIEDTILDRLMIAREALIHVLYTKSGDSLLGNDIAEAVSQIKEAHATNGHCSCRFCRRKL
jgi:hypothetical protein